MGMEAISSDWLVGAMGSAPPARSAHMPPPPATPDTIEGAGASFQGAMRRHAAGVCIISTGQGEDVNGMVITAATSFSFDPPSVLVCINQSASIASRLDLGASFSLAVLGRQHELVAAGFCRKPSGRARFSHGDWSLEPDELPWLADAPANVACTVERTLSYGSHTAVIGAVRSARLGPDQPSLIYRDGRYDLSSHMI